MNNGQGAFTEVTGSAVSGTVYSHAPIFVDMDGDNDLDLLCANWGTGTDDETCTPGVSSSNEFYKNDGSGVFVKVTGSPFSTATYCSWSIAAGDLDGVRVKWSRAVACCTNANGSHVSVASTVN